MPRETNAPGAPDQRETAYSLGDLDLASSPFDDAHGPANEQRTAHDDDAHFYASLPTPQTAPAREDADPDEALWADLPSLELAHDPRNDVSPTAVKRPSPVPSLAAAQVAAAAAALDAPDAPIGGAHLPELGLAPNALLHTPLYAARALVYVAQLFSLGRRLERERSAAQAAFDDALAELGRALLSVRESPELAQLRTKFVSIDEKLSQRATVDGALRELRVSRAAQEQTMAAELVVLREQLAPFVERSASARATLRKAETDTTRAEAQTKRAEIALRAAKQAVSLPAGTNLDELERALAERKRELASAQEVRERARAMADGADAELERERGAERAHEQKRASLAQDADKRTSALEKRIELVGASENAALRALAGAARELKLSSLARGASDVCEKSARMLAAVDEDITRVKLGMQSVHAQSVAYGLGLCLLALGLLFFLVR